MKEKNFLPGMNRREKLLGKQKATAKRELGANPLKVGVPLKKIEKKADPESEGLNPAEERERNRCIQGIERCVRTWEAKNLPSGEEYDTERLADLVKWLGTEHADLIEGISRLFSGKEKYRFRPAVKICEGIDFVRPDIWLLGWREDEPSLESTDIHDHQDSEVAVYVFDGDIQEEVFAFDETDWAKDNSVIDTQVAVRGLSQGSTLKIKAPYIHLVSANPEKRERGKASVSIHAYYPPLDAMNIYEQRGKKLVKTETWHEVRQPNLHC